MSLSDKRIKGGCIENCACNSGDPSYNYDLKKSEIHYFFRDKDVRKAVRELKERLENRGDAKMVVISLKDVFRKIDEIFGEALV